MQEYCYNCMSLMEGDHCPSCGCRRNSIHAQDFQLQPGTVLQGRYLLGRTLGHGAFGITYIGLDLRLRRRVAVKEYYPTAYANRISSVSPQITLANADQHLVHDGKQKFLKEAQTLAEFWNVPGIVSIYDFFEENVTAYIVMEYLEGSTLKDALKYGTFSADDIISLMMPVMNALAIVHKTGIIHRDIAPDNLMLQPDGTLVLMDFGAAREYAMATQQSMTIMIKRGYAPEEQYRSRGEVGPWSDVYALCATMYYCITGIIPEESADRAVNDEIIWPSSIDIPISKAQERALRKGMAIYAEDRFRSVEELVAALSSSKPVRIKTKSAEASMPLTEIPQAPVTEPQSAQKDKGHFVLRISKAAVISAAALIAIAVVLFFSLSAIRTRKINEEYDALISAASETSSVDSAMTYLNDAVQLSPGKPDAYSTLLDAIIKKDSSISYDEADDMQNLLYRSSGNNSSNMETFKAESPEEYYAFCYKYGMYLFVLYEGNYVNAAKPFLGEAADATADQLDQKKIDAAGYVYNLCKLYEADNAALDLDNPGDAKCTEYWNNICNLVNLSDADADALFSGNAIGEAKLYDFVITEISKNALKFKDAGVSIDDMEAAVTAAGAKIEHICSEHTDDIQFNAHFTSTTNADEIKNKLEAFR